MEKVLCSAQGNLLYIALVGDLAFKTSAIMDRLYTWIEPNKNMTQLAVDLSAAYRIDSTNLGLIARFGLLFNKRQDYKPVICPGPSEQVKETLGALELSVIFRWQASDECYEPLRSTLVNILPPLRESETTVCERALQAHSVLSSLSEDNRCEFRSVMAGLHIERALMNEEESGHVNFGQDLDQLEVNRPYVWMAEQVQRH